MDIKHSSRLGIPGFGRANPWSHTNIYKFFFPEYLKYRELHSSLAKNELVSHAFHREFALSLSATSKNFSLWRETSKIGEVDSENPDLVYVKEKLFYQEIIDLFRRIGEPSVQIIRV